MENLIAFKTNKEVELSSCKVYFTPSLSGSGDQSPTNIRSIIGKTGVELKKCKNNRQEIISKCNKLISQYYSIDNILYNQIKFENLLIDYKWNNPDLNKLDNNELYFYNLKI